MHFELDPEEQDIDRLYRAVPLSKTKNLPHEAR